MKKNVKGKTLGRNAEHRKSLLRNLTISLIEHGEVKTTVSKAKYARPFIEKLVTRAKKGKLQLVKKRLVNEKAVRKLMGEIAERFKGYNRIVKLGRRDGDNTMMARIEWSGEVEEVEEKEDVEEKEEPKEKKEVEEEVDEEEKDE